MKKQLTDAGLYSDEHIVVNCCAEQHLNIIDRESCRPNGRLDFGLQYIADGCGYYKENGKIYPFERGTAILHFPGVPQHYSFKKEDNTVLLWAHFTGKLCEILRPFESNKTIKFAVANTKEFERIMRQMISASNIKAPYYETVCSGYMSVLLGLIAKNLQTDSAAAQKSHPQSIGKVINDMYLHFNEPIDLDKYAKMCCVSRSRFVHMFKEHTGVPPYRFQLQIRMERAIELLSYSKISIAECAAAVGFEDTSYFCRIFKKITSRTPTFYRE